jgi:hypothetical protein
LKLLWNGNECGKNSGNEYLNRNITVTDYDRSETSGECGTLKVFG